MFETILPSCIKIHTLGTCCSPGRVTVNVNKNNDNHNISNTSSRQKKRIENTKKQNKQQENSINQSPTH